MTEPQDLISVVVITKIIIKMVFIIKTRDSMMYIKNCSLPAVCTQEDLPCRLT